MTSFNEFELDPKILKAIAELGFETPTPIQAKAIPQMLSSTRDVIAFAQTGTGKTAAFGLPIIHKIEISNKKVQTIILCPTRELCMQITRDLSDFSKYIKGLSVVPVYGGASMETQIKALSRSAQVVVGTPGRVKDLIRRKKLHLNSIRQVILDEADEMLAMGFKEEMDFILSETPVSKQTMLFSATMSKEVMKITNTLMVDPIKLAAAPMNTKADNVHHVVYKVQAKDRYQVLKRITDMNPDIYGIVFCRTRRETKETASKLMGDGYNADALHGDLSQAQRDEVLNKFRKRQLQILVATDVAARGLDVKDLTHVVNYNMPDDEEVYVHRSGRTGRAGKKGISIAILHSREQRVLRNISKKFRIDFKSEPIPTGKDICKRQLGSLIDKIEKIKVDEKQIAPFLPEIYEKLESLSREDLIKHFVSAEFNRFLTYYKHAKDLNSPDFGNNDYDDENRGRGRGNQWGGRIGGRNRGSDGGRDRSKDRGRNRDRNVGGSSASKKRYFSSWRKASKANDGESGSKEFRKKRTDKSGNANFDVKKNTKKMASTSGQNKTRRNAKSKFK